MVFRRFLMSNAEKTKRYITLVIEHEGENVLPFDFTPGEYNSVLNGVVVAISLSNVISEMDVLETAIEVSAGDSWALEEALETARGMHDKCVKAHFSLRSSATAK